MEEHRRGPVRSEAARMAILQATATLFETRGYDNLTMEGIAAAAGVGKQTIYRWWPSKGALVADCLIEGLLFSDKIEPPNTGDLRADLTLWLQTIFDIVSQEQGKALVSSLIIAAVENEEVGARLEESLAPVSILEGRLQAAISSGEFVNPVPPALIGETLLGAVVLRTLSRSEIDAGTAAQLVSLVLDGRLRS